MECRIYHMSDCAVHNGPAEPTGPCSCGLEDVMRSELHRLRSMLSWVAGVTDARVEITGMAAMINDRVCDELKVQP